LLLSVHFSEHAALLTRVSNLVDHSQAKMAVFRSVVGGYKGGQNGADDVLDTLFNIFDHDVEATANVAVGAAMLLTGVDDDKKKDLLAKVHTWRRDVRPLECAILIRLATDVIIPSIPSLLAAPGRLPLADSYAEG
jgi:hypothetical protein